MSSVNEASPHVHRLDSSTSSLHLSRGGKTVTVRLNQPDQYTHTKVRQVRVFQKALNAIREFAKEVEQAQRPQE